MGRRSDHSRSELRAMILDAAERLIDADGPAAVSMRGIAKQVGYTVGTLYLVFPNQDALLLSVNLRTADALQQALRNAADNAQDSADALAALARGYVEFAERQPHRWRLLFELDADLPEFANPVADRVQALFALVESQLGGPRSTRRARAAALWAGVHGLAQLSVTGRAHWTGSDTPGPALQALLDAFRIEQPE